MNLSPREPRRTFSWPLALILVALIGAALVIIIFLRLESWPGRTARQSAAELERLGRNVRDAFVEVAHLEPRVTINNRVYLERTTATTQLAILSRQIEVEHEMLHSWAGSTKRVKLHGTFTAKVGFDLDQDVSVDLRPETVTIRLPHASLLSLEQNHTDVLAFENGFWNRISAADLQNEIAALPELARRKVAESGILAQAEASFQKQLAERLPGAFHFDVVFRDAPTKD